MAASATLMRVLLALCALAAPALAVVGAGAGCSKGYLKDTCKGVTCCPGLKCVFTSTGGGYYCL